MSKVYESFKFPEVNREIARSMGLTAEEYDKACAMIGRTPNYIELGCISAMWSEHCSYKSSRKHLRKLPTTGKDVVYGPGENAGVVRVDGDTCICFKLESHNHPSFHDAFNGAATGVGGILRDVFTMGARPVAALNSLRFGDINQPKTRELLQGAIDGMAFYGNNVGVPMVGGEMAFHKSFATNPLVNAFVVGVVKEDKIFTAAATGVGNTIVYIGAKTGREGILGAAMASEEIGEGSEVAIPTTQKGDPFVEKQLMEACLEIMQGDAVIGIQDMGAAGLTSSSFEMAGKSGNGVVMNLELVPVKSENMNPYELMLSESQERMLMVAKKGREKEIIDIANKWNLEATIIGEVTNDGYVRLLWHGEEVAAVKAVDLVDNSPVYDRPSARPAWLDKVSKFDMSSVEMPHSLDASFLKLLSDPTICSKKNLWQRFDHESNLTATLPGSDAAIIKLEGSTKGVAMSVDCNSRYCYLNPREGAKHAVAESARNVAACGAVPMALTNCLNYGSPEKPEGMYQLIEGIEGIAEASLALDAPVISGNVSLYNETDGKSIYPTPAIVVTGVIDNVEDKIDSFFQAEGDCIMVLGEFPKTLAASHFLETEHGIAAGELPNVNLPWHRSLIHFMAEGAKKRIINAAHDMSMGGIAVSMLEMGAKNKIGVEITLPPVARADALLFGESPMMILAVAPSNVDAVKALAIKHSMLITTIGETKSDHIQISSADKILINQYIGKCIAMSEKTMAELIK